jgi:hypothetical protein
MCIQHHHASPWEMMSESCPVVVEKTGVMSQGKGKWRRWAEEERESSCLIQACDSFGVVGKGRNDSL